MEKTVDYEGSLLVEVFKVYEEMYCSISGRDFQAFKKAQPNLPADANNKAELALQVVGSWVQKRLLIQILYLVRNSYWGM
jgi:hypothetical protein